VLNNGLSGKSVEYGASMAIPFWINTIVVFDETAGLISSAVEGTVGKALEQTIT
jgi:hypothetical protein